MGMRAMNIEMSVMGDQTWRVLLLFMGKDDWKSSGRKMAMEITMMHVGHEH